MNSENGTTSVKIILRLCILNMNTEETILKRNLSNVGNVTVEFAGIEEIEKNVKHQKHPPKTTNVRKPHE